MKMLFKQRMFSWFDSYDIYDEYGNTLFVVKGQLSWGHCLRIFDAAGCPVGAHLLEGGWWGHARSNLPISHCA